MLEQLTSAPARSRKAPAEAPREPTVTTAVHVPKRTLDLLVRVAAARKVQRGGRASVSAVIVSVIEAQRAALERELASD